MMHETFEKIREIASLLCKRNWSERNAGNISLRFLKRPDWIHDWKPMATEFPSKFPALANQHILITAAGSRMREIMDDEYACSTLLHFSKVGSADQLYIPKESSCPTPSSELPTHLYSHAILSEHHPEEKTIVHAHVLPLIVLSHHPAIIDSESLNAILLRIHPETMFFLPEGAGFIPFDFPGSDSLAISTASAFHRHRVVIWERHGALACAPDLTVAFDRLDIAAKAAEIFLQCKNAGYTPKALTMEEINALKKHYKLH